MHLKNLDQNVFSVTGMDSISKMNKFSFDYCLPNFEIQGAVNAC